jgi:hypothetical protein
MVVPAPLQFVVAGLLVVFLFLLLIGIWVIGSVYMVYWTYRDANEQQIATPELWAVLVLLTHVIGFVVYLLVRE